MLGLAAIGYSPFPARDTKTPALELQILTKLFRGFFKFFSILFHVKTPHRFGEFCGAEYDKHCCASLWGERRDSNPRPSEPQSDALPTELLSPYGAGGEDSNSRGLAPLAYKASPIDHYGTPAYCGGQRRNWTFDTLGFNQVLYQAELSTHWSEKQVPTLLPQSYENQVVAERFLRYTRHFK